MTYRSDGPRRHRTPAGCPGVDGRRPPSPGRADHLDRSRSMERHPRGSARPRPGRGRTSGASTGYPRRQGHARLVHAAEVGQCRQRRHGHAAPDAWQPGRWAGALPADAYGAPITPAAVAPPRPVSRPRRVSRSAMRCRSGAVVGHTPGVWPHAVQRSARAALHRTHRRSTSWSACGRASRRAGVRQVLPGGASARSPEGRRPRPVHIRLDRTVTMGFRLRATRAPARPPGHRGGSTDKHRHRPS